MAKSPVGADIHQPLDVGGHISSEVSLHLIFLVNDIPDANHLCFGELVHFGVFVDVRLLEDFIG